MTRGHLVVASIFAVLLLDAMIAVTIIAAATIVAPPAFGLVPTTSLVRIIIIGRVMASAGAAVPLPMLSTIVAVAAALTTMMMIVITVVVVTIASSPTDIGIIVRRVVSSPSLAPVMIAMMSGPGAATAASAFVAQRRVVPGPSFLMPRRWSVVLGGGIVSPSPPHVVVIITSVTWAICGHTDHNWRFIVTKASAPDGSDGRGKVIVRRWAHIVEVV